VYAGLKFWKFKPGLIISLRQGGYFSPPPPLPIGNKGERYEYPNSDIFGLGGADGIGCGGERLRCYTSMEVKYTFLSHAGALDGHGTGVPGKYLNGLNNKKTVRSRHCKWPTLDDSLICLKRKLDPLKRILQNSCEKVMGTDFDSGLFFPNRIHKPYTQKL